MRGPVLYEPCDPVRRLSGLSHYGVENERCPDVPLPSAWPFGLRVAEAAEPDDAIDSALGFWWRRVLSRETKFFVHPSMRRREVVVDTLRTAKE